MEADRHEDIVKYLSAVEQGTGRLDYDVVVGIGKCVRAAISRKKARALKALVEAAGAALSCESWNAPWCRDEPALCDAFRTGDLAIVDIVRGFAEKDYLADSNPRRSRYPEHGIRVLQAAFVNKNPACIDSAWELLRRRNAKLIQTASWCPVHDLAAHSFAIPEDSSTRTGILEDVLEFLTEKGFDINGARTTQVPPLCIAASERNLEGVRALIHRGADVFVRDSHGDYAWTIACIRHDQFEIVEELLQAANVAAHRVIFEPFLRAASQYRWLEALRYLLREGVDVLGRDEKDRTPLMIALAAGRQNEDVIRCLIQHMLDGGNRDNDRHMIDALKLLLSSDVYISKQYTQNRHIIEQMLSLVRRYRDAGIDLNVRNDAGHTLLMDIDTICLNDLGDLLFESGCAVNAVSQDGCTVLWRTIAYGDKNCYDYGTDSVSLKLSVLGKLLAQNLDMGISAHECQGMTPLLLAYMQRDHTLCSVLLDYDCERHKTGAHIASKAPGTLTPEMEAVRNRILQACEAPYPLKALARLTALRAMGQRNLRPALSHMFHERVLPKALVNYLGKALRGGIPGVYSTPYVVT